MVVSKEFEYSRKVFEEQYHIGWNTEINVRFLSCRQGLEQVRYPWKSYDVEDDYNIIDEKM